MKNIVVAIDFTPLTGEVLRQSAIMAGRIDTKLWLVHVAAPDPDFVGYEVGPQYIRDERAKELRKEHREIQRYAKELEDQNIEAEALLIQGELVKTLLREATGLKADLIVAGAHSRSALFDKLVGNASQLLIRQSTIPLLIVPEKMEE